MCRLMIGFLLVVAGFAQEPFDEKDPREIIEKVRIYRLTQELDLTTEQALKLFPKLHELRKIEQEFHKERRAIIFELKRLIDEKSADKEIANLLAKHQEVRKKRSTAELKNFQEIKDILTPVQQAKFLIFQDEFEREIRDLIKEVKKRRPSRK